MESELRFDKAPWDNDDLGIEVTVYHKDGGSINGRLTHIHGLQTWNTGGGCMVDIIKLQDGRFLGLSEELVVLYNNKDEFYGVNIDGEGFDPIVNQPQIDLIKENYTLVERETILHGEAVTVKAFRCITYVSRSFIQQEKPAEKSVADFLRDRGKADSSERMKKFPYLDTEIAYDFQSKLWEVKTYWEGKPLKEIAPIKVKIDQEVVSFRALDPELGDAVLLDSNALTHLITIMRLRNFTPQQVVDSALSSYYFQLLSEAEEMSGVITFDENQKRAQSRANKIIYG